MATHSFNDAAQSGNPEVEVEHGLSRDCYTGTKAALIAAGIASDGQFPGDPGRGTASCGYFDDGTPCPGPGRHARTVWLQIRRVGSKRFAVRICVSADEAERRRRAAADERLAEVRREADAALASAAAAAAVAPEVGPGMVCQFVPNIDSPAMLHVGDRVTTQDGRCAVVSEGYRYHNVEGSGARAGYVVRLESGAEVFYPAGELWDRVDERPRYLRLASSSNAADLGRTHHV